MGRAKVLSKKMPTTTTKDVLESTASNVLPVQRKRGRPRKVTKEEVPVEKKEVKEDKLQLTESVDVAKKRKRAKKPNESTESGQEANGTGLKLGEEPDKPQIVKREGSRRKSEPRRAAGACLNTQ